jgi:hypothetical protein
VSEATERDREMAAKLIGDIAFDMPGVWGIRAEALAIKALAAARAEGRREAMQWRDPATWELGTNVLICCRGVNQRPGYRGSVSYHYGMASLPAGTIGWLPLPEPPAPRSDAGAEPETGAGG